MAIDDEVMVSPYLEENNNSISVTDARYIFNIELILPDDETLKNPPSIKEIMDDVENLLKGVGYTTVIKPIKQEFCYD